MRKLLIILLTLALSCNTYGLTQKDIQQANIQPYLKTFIKHIWIVNHEKIIDNNIIIAESNYQGDIFFYNSNRITLSDQQLEDVIRHEIGHIVYWRLGYDVNNNSEEMADKFKDLSKDTDSIVELIYNMKYLEMK